LIDRVPGRIDRLGRPESRVLLARGRNVEFLWKLHRPWHGGHAAEELAVDEIREPAKEEPERRNDDEIVAEISPRDLVPPRIPERVERQPDHAAMARHAAVPEPEKQERIRTKRVEIVEQHVTQPPAEHDAEDRAPDDEIAHRLGLEIGVALTRKALVERDADEERGHVGEAIPAHAKTGRELDEKRAEVVNVVGEKHRSPGACTGPARASTQLMVRS
jgi:hypothetical protein